MNEDYARIEKAIGYIRSNIGSQPSVERIAAHVGVSVYHFHRLFRRWAGISPKRYLSLLTVDQARQLLGGSRSVLDVSLELGLSSPSRLHEQFVSIEAVTPGEFKTRGQGIEIAYGVHAGPFGETLIAQTRRGICFLAFTNQATLEKELNRLRRLYPLASLRGNPAAIAATAQRLFDVGETPGEPFHLLVKGTNFQINVWRGLLRIPRGGITSYRQLAQAVGRGDAVRAVANAVAANPVHYLIPCHRVLRANGDIGGFRAGIGLKRELLDWEQGSA